MVKIAVYLYPTKLRIPSDKLLWIPSDKLVLVISSEIKSGQQNVVTTEIMCGKNVGKTFIFEKDLHTFFEVKGRLFA